jgi:phosphoglycerate-specific signal transduction histidine kinase
MFFSVRVIEDGVYLVQVKDVARLLNVWDNDVYHVTSKIIHRFEKKGKIFMSYISLGFDP